MVSATPMTAAINAPASAALTRQDLVPSRKKVTLPAWLEIAKPRLIPLLLATTLGGMALSEGWPLPLPRLACTLGGGALAAAAAKVAPGSVEAKRLEMLRTLWNWSRVEHEGRCATVSRCLINY